MDAFHNRVLHIDVTQKSYEEEPINEEVFFSLLGGKGLATYILTKNTTKGVHPLSEDNVIIFATGPATNAKVFGTSRYGVFTKSPLTGIFCESYSGGTVAEHLCGTGYDAITIKGASEKPIYLEISENTVKFHDAARLWGMDTYSTEDVLRREIEPNKVGISVIGPAGENLVRFSSIGNDYWRSAGRAGAGAVLGSKRIKAVVFHGNKQKKVANAGLLTQLYKETASKGKTDPGAMNYRKYGTPMLVALTNTAGAFPTKYWSAGKLDGWEEISAEALLAKCEVKPRACPKCFLACSNLTKIIDGKHKGLIIEGPEYETIYAFGGLCMVKDIREIAYLNDICDRLGMDTISAGNIAAFAIEASHHKDIGMRIEYGDADSIAELLHKIALKDGVGKLLSEGIVNTSKEWNLEDLAIHVKGLEPAGYDPRVLTGMGLAYATSDRGACHLRATIYKAELSGTIGPGQVDGKAELLIDFEDRHTLFDSLILCRFFRDLYPWDKISLIIKGTTGMALDKEGLRRLALNISDQVRKYNVREGMNISDDTLPKRFFEERLQDSGKILVRNDFKRMLSDYYHIKGWDFYPNQ